MFASSLQHTLTLWVLLGALITLGVLVGVGIVLGKRRVKRHLPDKDTHVEG